MMEISLLFHNAKSVTLEVEKPRISRGYTFKNESTYQKRQKVVKAQMIINRRMDEPSVVHPDSGRLLGHEKEGNIGTC